MRRLALLLILSLLPLSAQAAFKDFKDLDPQDPSLEAIEDLQASGVIEGYEDGSFQSKREISRAEFIKVIVGSQNLDYPAQKACFSDMSEDDWFLPYVCFAKSQGWVSGYEDGLFRPHQTINFVEASKILNAALLKKAAAGTGPWYQTAIEALAEAHAIPLSIPSLEHELSRGESVEMLYRLMNPEKAKEKSTLIYEELAGLLPKAKSCEALDDFTPPNYPVLYDAVREDSPADSEATESVGSGSGEKDYTSTNIQQAGVDEFDRIKTNGDTLFSVGSFSVSLVDLRDDGSMNKLEEIAVEGFYPNNLLLDGKYLAIQGNRYEGYDYYDLTYADAPENSRIAMPLSSAVSVLLYDVSQPAKPKFLREYQVEGYSAEGRLIDGQLTLAIGTSAYPWYYYGNQGGEEKGESLIPLFWDSKTDVWAPITSCTSVYTIPRERGANFLSVVSFPIDGSGSASAEVVMGYSENMYMSTEHLFLTSTSWGDSDYYLRPEEISTRIHRFTLGAAGAKYEKSGEVPGMLLNRYSLSEYGDYLRVVTHDFAASHLFVLGKNLEQVGSLKDLGTTEQLHSVRFMGKRAYLVTFKNTDPLFVVDLSQPTLPRLMGELKIPGYSDYLHPFGDRYLIGLGKEAVEASADFAWYQGVKLALFDVSNPRAPKEVDSVSIGDRGTNSEALYDPHAFFFDESRGLLAIPVEVADVPNDNTDPSAYGEIVGQAAYVYHLSADTGFELLGTLSNITKTQSSDPYDYSWYDYSKFISRILRVEETLYTLATGQINSYQVDGLEPVDELVLP